MSKKHFCFDYTCNNCELGFTASFKLKGQIEGYQSDWPNCHDEICCSDVKIESSANASPKRY